MVTKEQNHRYYLKNLAANPNLNKESCKKHYRKNPTNIVSKTNNWRHSHLPQFNAGFAARHYSPLKNHCELCKRKDVKLERMHLDYTKPLDVVTTCRFCHKKVDQTIKEYNFAESSFVESDSRHCQNCLKKYPDCGRGHPSFHGRNCMLWKEAQNEPSHGIACNTEGESK